MKLSLYSLVIGLLILNNTGLMAQPTKRKSNPDPPTKANNVALKDVKSKEISLEFSCNANATIYLENIFRRVNVLTSGDNKVRLVTTVYYQGDPSYSDTEWLQKLELGISGNASNVVVKSGSAQNAYPKKTLPDMPLNRRPDTAIANGIAVFDSTGEWVNKKSNIKRNLVLYIPSGVKLDIESKYSDITVENNLKIIKIRITNGSLSMKDAEKLIVNGLYGNIYAGNIGDADVDMANGRFIGRNIVSSDIKSKNSVIELNSVNQLALLSHSDNIDIEELGAVKGQKDYGDLRVTFLKNSFDLHGQNADIKIRNIDPGVTLVKIDDQYADLRLPIDNLKNYTVNFEGLAGRLYASFEKTPLSDSSFKASVGNITDKSTRFELKCDNCTVDFK